ncbi:MAG: mercuric transporter MerT family protein, partial [Bradymonadaceae bacterium]
TQDHTSQAGPRVSAGFLSSSGAVVAAIFASACCWLPLLLIGLGASSMGVAGFFEAYRSLLLGVTGVFLVGGFYFVYFRKPRCAPGDSCALPNSTTQRLNKLSLWVATILVVVFAAFPNYVGVLLADEGSATTADSPPADSSTTDVERLYSIEGMTCSGCTGSIRSAIAKVPGVKSAKVSYADLSATVIFESGDYDDEAIIAAVKSAGFTARHSPDNTDVKP